MTLMNSNHALASLQETGTYGKVEEANGHELIRLLLDTLSIRITEAKNCIEEDDINEKIVRLTKALNILDGLRMALNEERAVNCSKTSTTYMTTCNVDLWKPTLITMYPY